MSIRFAIIATVLGSFISLAISAAPVSATTSDAATAQALNLIRSELPHPSEWTTTPQAPNTAAETALGIKAVACIKASSRMGAKVSGDPFGTSEVVGGTVTADVESPSFEAKDSADASGLPTLSSEVVMLKSASEAANDLSAFASRPARGCLTNLLAGLSKTGNEKWNVASTSQAVPHLGTGSGGFGFRFTVTGKGLPGPLIDYTYFYVQGRAELALEFADLDLYPTASANAIAKLVMGRAKVLLG